MCVYELLLELNGVVAIYSIVIIDFTISITSFEPHGTQYHFRIPYIG